MTAHKPATALPWHHVGTQYTDDGDTYQAIETAALEDVVGECGPCAKDAAYIAHAANAYPKLVEALREMVAPSSPNASDRSRALLRELGEAE